MHILLSSRMLQDRVSCTEVLTITHSPPPHVPSSSSSRPPQSLLLSLQSLEAFKGAEKIIKIISHIRLGSSLGRRFLNLLNWHQISTGFVTPLLSGAPVASYVYSPWITDLQKFLLFTSLRLRSDRWWTPTPLRIYDSSIMGNLFPHYTKPYLKDVNAARLFLKVTMVSEITSSDGTFLSPALFLRRQAYTTQIQPGNWPTQPSPSRRA